MVETDGRHSWPGSVDQLPTARDTRSKDVGDGSESFSFSLPELDVPRFDGKETSFKMWLQLFRVFASLHGFLDALDRKDRMPGFKKKSNEELISAGHSRKDVMQARRAFLALRSSSEDDVFKGIVQTGDGPNDAYAALVEHFTPPRSLGSIAKLTRDLSNLKLPKSQNPRDLLKDVLHLAGELNEMGSPLSNRAVLAFFFDALPEEYDVEIAALKIQGEEDRQAVLSVMMSRWRSLQRERENRKAACRERRKGGKSSGVHGSRKNRSKREASVSEDEPSGAGDCRRVGERLTICDLREQSHGRVQNCRACGGKGQVVQVCASNGSTKFSGSESERQRPAGEYTFVAERQNLNLVAGEIWFTYSGGEHHVTFSPRGLYDFKACAPGTEVRLTMDCVPVIGFGKLDVHLETDSPKGCCRMTLHDVALAPCIDRHWFSLIAAVEKGYKAEIGNGACRLVKVKENPQSAVEDDVVFRRTHGLYCAVGHRLNPPIPAVSGTSVRVGGKVLDINRFHCSYGHVQDENLLRSAAAQLDVALSGELWPCTGCSEAREALVDKGVKAPRSTSVKPRAVRKLQRVFVEMSQRKKMRSLGGSQFAMSFCDEYTGYLWVYFLARQADVAASFGQFLAEVRKDGHVEVMVTEDSRLAKNKAFWDVCDAHGIRSEVSPAHGASPRGLDVLERASHAAIAEAPQLFPDVELPDPEDLWAEALAWAREALNRIPLAAGSSRKSPNLKWHGKEVPTRLLPFLTPGFYTPAEQTRALHPPRSIPCFYLWTGCRPVDHVRVMDSAYPVVQTCRASYCGPQTPLIEACPPPAVKRRNQP